jgi:hypothetical protein
MRIGTRRVVLARKAEVAWPGGNLIDNGSFTVDTAGWSALGAVLSSEAGGQSGNCLFVTNTTDYGVGYQAVTVVAGVSYRCSYWHYNGAGANAIYGLFGIGSSSQGKQYYDSGAINDPDTWVQRSATFTPTGTTVYISGWVNSSVVNKFTEYDEIVLWPT